MQHGLVDARWLSGQCVVVSGRLMAEEAKTCFVLPLREAVAHFARRDSRSAETEVGGSDYVLVLVHL